MGKIISIGGGELKFFETLAIDKEVVAQTGKKTPNALFIPTASEDEDPEATYYPIFQMVYGKKLGCPTDVLYLIREKPSFEEIKAKIEWADLIYVGGGNTLRMMNLWRNLGVDNLLRQAFQDGTVLSGLSAGAICWFHKGHSDSRSFKAKDDNWDYIFVTSLGLADMIYCPHVDGENRLENLQNKMRGQKNVCIGCDDNCAIEIIDDQYRIITSQPDKQAYRLYWQKGEVITEILEPDDAFQPLSHLIYLPK